MAGGHGIDDDAAMEELGWVWGESDGAWEGKRRLGFGGEEEGAGGCSDPPGKTTGRRGMAATAPSVAMAPVDHCHNPPM